MYDNMGNSPFNSPYGSTGDNNDSNDCDTEYSGYKAPHFVSSSKSYSYGTYNASKNMNGSTVYYGTQKPDSSLAISCFVLSLVGFLTGWIFIGFIFDAAGIVLAIISMAKHKGGKGFAIAGLVISIVSIVSTLIIYFMIGAFTMGAAFRNGIYTPYTPGNGYYYEEPYDTF